MDKQCCTCKLIKPIEEFGKDNSAKDKLCPRCRLCERERAKKVYHKSSSETKLRRKLRMYKLAREEYDNLCRAQNGACALCGSSFGKETPYIDHDHKTGRVRGLLHNQCNSVIGHAKDDIILLRYAIEYLQKN